MKNNKPTCIIVDDDQPARDLIKSYINRQNIIECLGDFKIVDDAIEFLNKKNVDIIFLDIQMPKKNGIDFLKEYKIISQTIVTTAYRKYAIDSFDLNVSDYLLKPFNYERFLKAVNKSINQIKLLKNTEQKNKTWTIKIGREYFRYNINNIIIIKGLSEYVEYKIINESKKIISYEKLIDLEKKLPKEFIRIHKSFIINSNYVKKISGKKLITEHGAFPISVTYFKSVKKKLSII